MGSRLPETLFQIINKSPPYQKAYQSCFQNQFLAMHQKHDQAGPARWFSG
ncbi:mCG147107 [Mus musculus]|nr:mCG147107 [Mus musculus]